MFNKQLLPWAACLVAISCAAPATAFGSNADSELEQRLSEGPTPTAKSPAQFSMSQALAQFRQFRNEAQDHMNQCADAQKTVIGGKYLATVDEKGAACRVYDLSFPNLKAALSGHATDVPVRKMGASDFLNFLDEDFASIDARDQAFNKNFDPKTVAVQSWVSKLKFKVKPEAVQGSQSSLNDLGLPKSFYLSDLDLGTNFQFDADTQAQIQKLLAEVKGSKDPGINEYLLSILQNPNIFLQGVHINWNDLKKVYEVIMEGEFVPLKPVALISYQEQYKYAIEKEFRSILSSGLQKLAAMIPNPIIQGIINVVVVDGFEQLETAYQYQMMQLEDSLRGTDPSISDRALNVLYGERADLLSAYILATAQQKPFDWNNLEKLGYSNRYQDEKTRAVTMAKMNNKLVQEKNCQMSFVHDYFGLCANKQNGDGMYSLISERTVLSHSFGAPLIYSYKTPSQTTLRRGAAWLLSIGLRVVGLPIAQSLVPKLDGILKDYMTKGILDEALLRNNMMFKGQTGDMVNWLYIQNLDLFLPKSVDSENHMIEANKKLLGVQ